VKVNKMLTSPISVVIGAGTHSLSRINTDNFASTYFKKGSNYEVKLVVRHSYEGKTAQGQIERHNADLTYTAFDAEGKPSVTQSYVVIRAPRGADGALAADVAEGLEAFVTANSAAIVAWES
jgi:hypothetical protein